MKKLLSTLLIIAGLSARAQTVTVTNTPNLLTNGPVISALANLPNVPFTEAKLEISAGAVMHGASTFENELSVNYNFSTNFFVGGQFQSGTASSVIDSAGFVIGIRKPWVQTEIYADLGARRNFTLNKYEGIGAFGVAYKPTTALTGVALYVEQRIVVGSAQGQPNTETVAGVRFSF